MYPCAKLADGFPDGYWENTFVSNLGIFVGGLPQSFEGNFMLLRNEYVKFKYGLNGKKVAKTEKELLCGPRYSVI